MPFASYLDALELELLSLRKWKRVFAWWPVHTEDGKVWLTWVMQGSFRWDEENKLYLTCVAYVNYRMEDMLE